MFDIKNAAAFEKITPINKGWSSDNKYYIETVMNERLLLRIADFSEYDKKKNEYEMMTRFAESGLPISQPVDFGLCNSGKSVYLLLKWCYGEDAELVLPLLSEVEQYGLGVKAGEILRQFHSIPAPMDQEDWGTFFNKKTDMKIKNYRECGLKIDGEGTFISYLEENRNLLEGRPQCFQHGDYHVGNMVISQSGELSIIDFNRIDFGDPWEEFNRIVWTAAVSPHFATGQLNGYFNGRPPVDFFRLLAFYICSNTLSSIPWAIPFGEEQVTVMKNQAKEILNWYDGMNHNLPTWYLPHLK